MVHNFYQIGGGEHTVFNNEKELLEKNGHFVATYIKDNSILKGNLLKLLTVPFSTIFSIKTYLDVKKIIKMQNIEIVHCHNTFPLVSPSVYYAAWHSKIPVVQTVHNFRFICANGLLYRDKKICEDCVKGDCHAVKHGCYRNSKIQTIPVVAMQKIHKAMGTYKRLNYIFLTEFNKNKMVPLLNPKGQVFIKTNFVKTTELLTNITVDKNKFIFVGRLDEYKGIDFLLEFFKEHKEISLHIYGNGSLEEKVQAAANECENIKYMGFKPHHEMDKDWQTSCALIFSGLLYEGQPMTIIESMAKGVPIICTDIGNPATLIEPGVTGEYFKMGDTKTLQAAIISVQANKEKLSINVIKQSQQYGEEKNYKTLTKIYEIAKL